MLYQEIDKTGHKTIYETDINAERMLAVIADLESEG